MKLPFLNREQEKERLRDALSRSGTTFCCVYGRRRTGKSRLLQETILLRRTIYFLCDESEPPLQREALAGAMAKLVPGMAEVRYPDWASLLERWWREAPTGSILVLDEFPYLVKTNPEVPSILQRLLDQPAAKSLRLVICGSSQRMMQGLVLAASAPLYGRAREIIEVKPLKIYWLGRALGFSNPSDILEAYGVWGGIPHYWEMAAEYRTTWQAVEDLVLDPMGILHQEPRRLLLDDMRETTQGLSILTLIGRGCQRLSEIAGRLNKPATSLTRPIQKLLELGLIHREVPFGESERSGKRSLYRIQDPFLLFWFRYVEPNLSRLETGFVRQIREEIRQNFPLHLAEIWENVVRLAVPRLQLAGLEWHPARRWWGTTPTKEPVEIDLLAESSNRKNLLVGEVKLRLKAEKIRKVGQDLVVKSKKLPFLNDYKKIIPAVFVLEEKTIVGQPEFPVVTANKILSVLR